MNAQRPRSTAVFRRDGVSFVPQGLAAGPWYPGSQHGSAMLGLVARAVESHPSERPMQTVRLTVDMMRAAPMGPVRTEVRVTRKGKSVELIEATLHAGDEVCARASAMRFRVNPVPVPEDFRGEAASIVLPDSGSFAPPDTIGEDGNEHEAFHHALEIRPVPGFELPVVWLRLRVPLVEGEEPSPLVRAAVAADFTYSLPTMRRLAADPSQIGQQTFAAINPDTALNLHRPVVGEWVAIYCHVFYAEQGAGSAHAQLYDELGVVGHASQSLLIRTTEQQPSVWRARHEREPS